MLFGKINTQPGSKGALRIDKLLARGQDKGKKVLLQYGSVIFYVLFVLISGLVLSGCKDEQAEATGQESTNSVVLKNQDEGAKAVKSSGPETVLATVNKTEITLQDLEEALTSLSDSQKKAYAGSKQDLLESLIMRTVLLQEAKRLQIEPGKEDSLQGEQGSSAVNPGQQEAISRLFEQEVFQDLKVEEEDLRSFYEQNKDQLPKQSSFADLKEQLRPYVLQMQKQEAADNYIDSLMQEAKISKNQDWIAAQEAKSADNPLSKALENGRPVLADFGSKGCIPCKMMEPILEELKKEYQGRAEILFFDVNKYPNLSRRYSIRTIPTQIFFNVSGEEVQRHQGFMSKEDIIKVLRDLNVAAN